SWPMRLRRRTRAEGLRPELVPGVEIAKVLRTLSNPTVLELEDEDAVNRELLAVPLPGVVMNANDTVVIICEHLLQFGPAGPSRPLSQLAEVGESRIAALVVAGQ